MGVGVSVHVMWSQPVEFWSCTCGGVGTNVVDVVRAILDVGEKVLQGR